MQAKQTELSRRDFIKTASLAGGSVLLGLSSAQAATPRPTGQSKAGATTQSGSPAVDLHGVSDIHIHATPDSRPRSINELEFAKKAKEAGYRAIMYKSNDWSCHDRAWLVREAVPNMEVFGSVILNRLTGGINPYAVEQALKTEGNYCRCIWLPTLDAAYQCSKEGRGPGIAVLDTTGAILPEVVKVMELCGANNIILATGHCSPQESLCLARKAREIGLNKFVVTHVNSLIWTMTPEQIREITDLGVYVELCALPMFWGKGTSMPQFPWQSPDIFTAFARIAPESTFISTDMGQAGLPSPLHGMAGAIAALRKAGISQAHIELMTKTTPARLVGLEK